jgi:hypothetical protein
MHHTGLPILPAPAASSTRRTAAGVKADRRSPAGLGLDTGEDRRTLATAGAANPHHVHQDHVHNADERTSLPIGPFPVRVRQAV